MNYEFSLSAFLAGLLILAIGVVLTRYHQWVANNFGGGVGQYERYKLYALLVCVFGFVVLLNLHTLFLEWLVSMIFRR